MGGESENYVPCGRPLRCPVPGLAMGCVEGDWLAQSPAVVG